MVLCFGSFAQSSTRAPHWFSHGSFHFEPVPKRSIISVVSLNLTILVAHSSCNIFGMGLVAMGLIGTGVLTIGAIRLI